jgi:hypothetical protein
MKIEKLSYSRQPWRLVDSEGREIYSPQVLEHPSLGMTVYSGPVCGDTKTECIDNALNLLEVLLRKNSKIS